MTCSTCGQTFDPEQAVSICPHAPYRRVPERALDILTRALEERRPLTHAERAELDTILPDWSQTLDAMDWPQR